MMFEKNEDIRKKKEAEETKEAETTKAEISSFCEARKAPFQPYSQLKRENV